jgi:hypothetical protein
VEVVEQAGIDNKNKLKIFFFPFSPPRFNSILVFLIFSSNRSHDNLYNKMKIKFENGSSNKAKQTGGANETKKKEIYYCSLA